jgi:hypothetical protein
MYSHAEFFIITSHCAQINKKKIGLQCKRDYEHIVICKDFQKIKVWGDK